MTNMRRLTVTMALLVGCLSCSKSTVTVDHAADAEPSVELTKVTFYVAGMNQKLQILWGDWPNKVKQALVELDGVETIEDEWERELEGEQFLDLLFVTYNAQRVTVARMMEIIRDHDFEVEVRDEG